MYDALNNYNNAKICLLLTDLSAVGGQYMARIRWGDYEWGLVP
jgi:hypothetical protein